MNPEKSRVDKLIDLLESKRTFYNDSISEMIAESVYLDKIPEVQVKMLSIRHKLIDYLANDLSRVLVKSNNLLNSKREEILIEMRTKSNLDLKTEKQKTIILDSKTRDITDIISSIDFQMYFVKENIKLLDSLAFAIKNRIELYKFKNGA